jgi:hypothetical protein
MVRSMSASLCAIEQKPTSYALGASATPRASMAWKNGAYSPVEAARWAPS